MNQQINQHLSLTIIKIGNHRMLRMPRNSTMACFLLCVACEVDVAALQYLEAFDLDGRPKVVDLSTARWRAFVTSSYDGLVVHAVGETPSVLSVTWGLDLSR
jgi:hypothetical protein